MWDKHIHYIPWLEKDKNFFADGLPRLYIMLVLMYTLYTLLHYMLMCMFIPHQLE
jgi:hypothetical protein